MQRPYLHAPARDEVFDQLRRWHDAFGLHSDSRDDIWVIVDGALLGSEGVRELQAGYGPAVQAFDGTDLSAYEDLGLLLWPWTRLHDRDDFALLRAVMAEQPGMSFVRSSTSASGLGAGLAWLARVTTTDDLALYLRVGDTRVLASILPLLRIDQRAILQEAVHEWVWPNRDGRAESLVVGVDVPAQASASSTLVLDDAQYAALLEAAEPDMLHASLRQAESGHADERSGAELHAWLSQVLARCRALGIDRHPDQVAFASWALRVPGEFELLPELGDVWMRVRNGVSMLANELQGLTPQQWSALEVHWTRTQGSADS